jgi:hypothetical protein
MKDDTPENEYSLLLPRVTSDFANLTPEERVLRKRAAARERQRRCREKKKLLMMSTMKTTTPTAFKTSKTATPTTASPTSTMTGPHQPSYHLIMQQHRRAHMQHMHPFGVAPMQSYHPPHHGHAPTASWQHHQAHYAPFPSFVLPPVTTTPSSSPQETVGKDLPPTRSPSSSSDLVPPVMVSRTNSDTWSPTMTTTSTLTSAAQDLQTALYYQRLAAVTSVTPSPPKPAALVLVGTKEAAAIDAMLSLGSSSSSVADADEITSSSDSESSSYDDAKPGQWMQDMTAATTTTICPV